MKRIKAVGVIVVIIICAYALVGCNSAERDAAVGAYQTEISRIQTEQSALEEALDEARLLIESERKPYDAQTLQSLETAVTTAQSELVPLPEMPNDAKSINELTENQLKTIHYVQTAAHIRDLTKALEDSCILMERITNPSESAVIDCILRVHGITGIAAATEEHDPNGKLHKAGGYTSAVFFSYDKAKRGSLSGNSLLDEGTDAGGQIEVYETAEEAEKRNEYLSSFDGSFLNVGSHTVLGSMVIRTSDDLSASQQKELEANLISALSGEEPADNRQEKVSFNEATNKTVQVGLFTFSIPDYWEQSNDFKSENRYRAYAETGGKVVMLQISSDYDDVDQVSFEILKDETEKGNMAEAFRSWNESSSTVETELFEVSGVKGYLYKFYMLTNGLQGYTEVLLLPSVANNHWLYVVLAVAGNTDFRYSEDFRKTLSSIVYNNPG